MPLLLPFPPSVFFISTRRPKIPLVMISSASKFAPTNATIHRVPGFSPDESRAASEEALRRQTSPVSVTRGGEGVAIVWFRNDLRLHDHEALHRAFSSSEAVLPVYCVDPRHFASTHRFGFPKTGPLRAGFLIECIEDLKGSLVKRGSDLLIRHGKPEDVLPMIAKAFGAHTVYAHKETCSEELLVERLVHNGLRQVAAAKLQLVWGSTLYHIDDLPFGSADIPDIYTQFRKSVESKCAIRSCFKIPLNLRPPPSNGLDEVGGWGGMPSLEQLGLHEKKCDRGMHFIGGENAALARVSEYFWKKDLLKVYKETRNGMLGPDYSTKFSPWLAFGCLSSRYVYEEVKRYEKERQANDSTYWVLFELIWRDYFRFLSIKYGNSIFQAGGPRKVVRNWSQDQTLFTCWRDGRTGYPLIDANMRELSSTGFMSNRGRQIICSFLVRDMGIDWRMGAEWFETCLLDYDPCSNYGNWTYGAGVGNDPREDRYFSIPKQAQTYDPKGEYVAFWLPELQPLPTEKRHFPGNSYIKQVVPLKFGIPNNPNRHGNYNSSTVFRKQKRGMNN